MELGVPVIIGEFGTTLLTLENDTTGINKEKVVKAMVNGAQGK